MLILQPSVKTAYQSLVMILKMVMNAFITLSKECIKPVKSF